MSRTRWWIPDSIYDAPFNILVNKNSDRNSSEEGGEGLVDNLSLDSYKLQQFPSSKKLIIIQQ